MKHTYSTRNAFSLLEVIFVIVVLGIVSSIGASIIAKVYESYIVNRAQYRASIKSEQTLNQITNRLRYAIPGTVVAKDSPTDTTFTYLTEINTTATRHVLQWVGYDGDSFEAISSDSNRKPGWSGFIDLYNTNTTTSTLFSPGSNLGLTNEIIDKLSSSTKSLTDARLFFPGGIDPLDVTGGSGESISVSGLSSGDTITERYKLAWSSYAIVFEGTDLWLYYNFAPNIGQLLSTTGIKISKLLSNVTTFSFKGSEGSLRIKVCQYEYMDTNDTADAARSCKEKIILY